MPTDEVIENKDDFEKNTTVISDDADGQIPVDKGSADELDQEAEQAGSDDGNAAPSPSCDPLPDTEGDEPSEATVESEADSDSDSNSDSNDSHGDDESGADSTDTVDAVQADNDDDDGDDGTVAGVETESDSDTHSDDETVDDSEQEPDAIVNEHDEAESCDESADEPAGDSDTDTVEDVKSEDDDSSDDADIDTDTDTEPDNGSADDSETIGDVVTDSDMRVTVPIDLPNVDGDSGKPVPLRDGIHPEDDDTDRKSRVPRAVKVAAGVIATVAVTAALVTSTVAVMVVEIHPNVIGGETIASQQADGIDGSGKKISVSYTVGDALNSSDSDNPEILSWTDCWYTVAPGAKSVRAEIESAGKGSRIALSDGTSINVDGRYASKAGSFDAGIDIEGIAKLYGGDDSWVAIRYDASHVLVGKRVADGASEGE